ncbi:hypothetical protein [Dyadobacter sp. NIV53]
MTIFIIVMPSEQKKKWLFVSYLILAGIIYFLEFQGKEHFLDFKWLFHLR